MTWWAAVLGFAGALAGSWGGQLIASRREDRRWQREREREDLRHDREMEKLRLQHDRDVNLAWRAERHAAYTRLFTVMLALEPKFHAPIENPAVVDDPAQQKDFQRIHHELHDVYTLVMIGSSTAVDAAGRQLIGACKDLAIWYAPELRPPDGEKPDYEGFVRAFNAAFEGLIDSCRHELGLGPQARSQFGDHAESAN
ncbi:hypothetical protein [Amycolatopsis sp. RTGN1]|uniref:hypothetical protein n=1 Tax=Amycolatopsis ponsaeliensis TaxID=2992142 RepID=UPI00254F1F3B|nr:hypothetical protein [Amycolatopsis sp. RTGN1]